MADSADEGGSGGTGFHAGVSSGEFGGTGPVATIVEGPGSSGTGSLAEVALDASTSRTVGVANSVVPVLSSGTVDGGGDADSVSEVEASVAGEAEGVGQAAEAVG